jgi:hypothetical protein
MAVERSWPVSSPCWHLACRRGRRRRRAAHLVSVTLLAGVCVLSACNDKKAATKDNFKRVLTAMFDKGCAELSPHNGYGGNITFPARVKGDGFGRPAVLEDNNGGLRALVGAGMLSSKSEVETHLAFGTAQTTQTIVFDLTDKGRSLYKPANAIIQGSPPGLCAGPMELVSVDRFTEPADPNGERISQVTFTVQFHYDGWAKNPAIQKAFQDQFHPAPFQATFPMVLTNDGWAISTATPMQVGMPSD